MNKIVNNPQTAYLAGGCFWCLETVFKRLNGVIAVESGYMGGTVTNPSYAEVSSGKTGHAEVIKIVFDSDRISYADLLTVFFAIHDPTSLNRQGNDIGTQYRSAIFYLNAIQKASAQQQIALLEQQQKGNHPIVTELTEFSHFYPAENYHQDYFELNSSAPYCQLVIQPKLEHFQQSFVNLLKK